MFGGARNVERRAGRERGPPIVEPVDVVGLRSLGAAYAERA